MRALLSAVGTRGDVQPVIALAVEVRRLGHEVHLCVPPNFVDWAQALGFPSTAVGVEMRAPRKDASGASAPPPAVPDLIADQFTSIGAAAAECDIILGGNAHQYAAPSLAELHGIPYVNAVYAPTALPNDVNTRAWNERALGRVNTSRARLGLAPITDVLRHVVTDRPWLAFDASLASPEAGSTFLSVPTGAWLPRDVTSLPAELEVFLNSGERPVYIGFGSMPAAADMSRLMIEAARAGGRRVILSRGWAELALVDQESDCIAIGDVDHQALFSRVAAVVHHGGAGTTHTAALAGAPQVIVPMFGDQMYWASRVNALGIGASVATTELTSVRITSALHSVSAARVAERVATVRTLMVTDGAKIAAQRLVEHVLPRAGAAGQVSSAAATSP